MRKMIETIKSVRISKRTAITAGLAAFVIGNAVAGTGGLGDFDDTYTDIVDSLEGTIGRIITALAIGWGFFQIVKQNWLQVLGAFLGALILSNLDAIVSSVFTATII